MLVEYLMTLLKYLTVQTRVIQLVTADRPQYMYHSYLPAGGIIKMICFPIKRYKYLSRRLCLMVAIKGLPDSTDTAYDHGVTLIPFFSNLFIRYRVTSTLKNYTEYSIGTFCEVFRQNSAPLLREEESVNTYLFGMEGYIRV
jgi:hypothetical protein